MVSSVVAVDGVAASEVVRPAGEAETAAVIAGAIRERRAVVPAGGRRLLGMGGAAERVDVLLDTTAMNGVIEHSQADLTVSVQAGMTLEALNDVLGRAGQFLPLDPPGGPGHTIGGLVATALSGPLRLKYGSMRDFLIGLRVALPDGTLATSGGRVVKNVSGYDLNKLHLGALGSLGVVVAASFKVFPKPHHEVTVATDAEQPLAAANAALALDEAPAAVVLSSTGRVLCRLFGTRTAVEKMAGKLGWEASEAEEWTRLATLRSDHWARVSVPPTQLGRMLGAMPPGAEWWAYAGAASTIHWTNAEDAGAIRGARQAAEALGGSLVLLAAPRELKSEVDAWGTPPATIGVMRSLRDAFDPDRLLSPGRFVV